MSFLKSLPFGKKKNKTNASDNDHDRDFGEDGIDNISESVMESVSMQQDDLGRIDDSVAGSSVDMSAESIVGTAEENVSFMSDSSSDADFSNSKNGKKGFGFKSFFGGKKSSNKESEDDFESVSDSFSNSNESENNESDNSDASLDNRMREINAEIGSRPRKLPLIGRMPAKRQYVFALSTMCVSLIAAGFLSTTSLIKQGDLKERANVAIQTQLATQNIMLSAQNLVVRSDPSAYGSLAVDLNSLKTVVSVFSNNRDSESAKIIIQLINEKIIPAIETSLKVGAELATLGRQVDMLSRNTSHVYQMADQLSSYLSASSTSMMNLAAANDIRVRAERISRHGSKMLGSPALTLEPQAEFATNSRDLENMISALLDPANGLDETAKGFLNEMSAGVSAITATNIFMQKSAGAIVDARTKVVGIRDSIGSVSLYSNKFIAETENKASSLINQIYAALILAGLGISALILLALINNRQTRIESWDTSFKNKMNEKDIIDFMTEILPLEMGDLTVGFTGGTMSMEGITGGIRSSVNEAVISLRDAMSTVKSTTGSVMSNVSDSVESSRELQVSNDRQSKEIDDVVNRVADLTTSIDQVTDNTVRAADMTASARAASDTGARIVSETNQKMSEIRNNMQDVLKSVKHLGETSHEIGTIVEAIETITDRTQVIAVNASLEAAKAGAAGQGFQVLAGEVNRLAEQSNEALRTITALVQRIQGETAATIRVVEDSTSNVVEGARLSETANSELSKISALSEQLQNIMAQIRTQSESQTNDAGGVRESMDRLADLSKQFQASVSHMVTDVQQIDASMGTLQSTVSIFNTDKQAA